MITNTRTVGRKCAK